MKNVTEIQIWNWQKLRKQASENLHQAPRAGFEKLLQQAKGFHSWKDSKTKLQLREVSVKDDCNAQFWCKYKFVNGKILVGFRKQVLYNKTKQVKTKQNNKQKSSNQNQMCLYFMVTYKQKNQK